jgi:hypothetical protein
MCREIEKTVTAQEFELSLGVCEDVLDIINIDMFEGGLEALSNEAIFELAIPIIKSGFPFFKDLLSEIFEVSSDEIRRTKISDIAKVIVDIVKYSISQLKSLGGNKAKN